MERFSGYPFAYYTVTPVSKAERRQFVTASASCSEGQDGRDGGMEERESGSMSSAIAKEGPVTTSDGQGMEVLIIGGWPSVRFHMEEWIPSMDNRAFVEEVGELGVQVRWMWHVDVPRGEVQEVLDTVREEEELRMVLAVVKKAERDGWEGLLGEGTGSSESEGLVCGWRVDEGYVADGVKDLRSSEEAEEEFILLGQQSVVQKKASKWTEGWGLKLQFLELVKIEEMNLSDATS